jgi:very-short-patch-repair endonuclease
MNDELNKALAKSKREKLEKKFLFVWKALKGPALAREQHFDPNRKFRFDFCHTLSSVAIEVEGGQWIGGRHNTGAGFQRDAEKYFFATVKHGWTVVRLSESMLTREYLEPLIEFVNRRLG